jgi:hypothetical protein
MINQILRALKKKWPRTPTLDHYLTVKISFDHCYVSLDDTFKQNIHYEIPLYSVLH